MGNEHGEWIIFGVNEGDPGCLNSPDEVVALVDELGFLPLFKNQVPGFSLEERTIPEYWWTDDERDPWHWRQVIAESGKVAYGKFFAKKAAFISLKWFPYFANWRGEGYDFEGLWQNQKADYRLKRVMDLFADDGAIYSNEIKRKAGFGAGGEKNFEGVMTQLQMRGFLVVKDFAKRLNAKGAPYGWPVAIFTTPEGFWGKGFLSEGFKESPEQSKARFYNRLSELIPDIDKKRADSVLK